MSQASSILALGSLARTAGRGQAFNVRFGQEQALLGSLLRQRELSNQQANQQQNIQLQRTALAQKQQQIEFSQALQAEAAQREQQQQVAEQGIRQREREVSQKLRVRELERLESDLELRQAKFERQAAPPAISDVEKFTKQREDALKNLTNLSRIASSEQFLTAEDEVREPVLQGLESERARFNEAIRFLEDSEREVRKTFQERQTIEPVNKKDAGPELSRALEITGQSAPLDLPRDEGGVLNKDQMKSGKIYFFPEAGPGVWTGKGAITIDELVQRVPITTAESNRILQAIEQNPRDEFLKARSGPF